MKQSDEKLWDLFMNEETIPSKEQMNKWDEEISTVMSEKVKYERLLNNLSLLMALKRYKDYQGSC